MRVALVALRFVVPGTGLLAAAVGWVLAPPGDRLAVQWELIDGDVSRVLDAWIYVLLIAAAYCGMWARVATKAAASQRPGEPQVANPGRRSGLVMYYAGLGLILGVHAEVATANLATIEAEAATNRMGWDNPLVGTITGLVAGALALALVKLASTPRSTTQP